MKNNAAANKKEFSGNDSTIKMFSLLDVTLVTVDSKLVAASIIEIDVEVNEPKKEREQDNFEQSLPGLRGAFNKKPKAEPKQEAKPEDKEENTKKEENTEGSSFNLKFS